MIIDQWINIISIQRKILEEYDKRVGVYVVASLSFPITSSKANNMESYYWRM